MQESLNLFQVPKPPNFFLTEYHFRTGLQKYVNASLPEQT